MQVYHCGACGAAVRVSHASSQRVHIDFLDPRVLCSLPDDVTIIGPFGLPLVLSAGRLLCLTVASRVNTLDADGGLLANGYCFRAAISLDGYQRLELPVAEVGN
jgi:hypothetical protein